MAHVTKNCAKIKEAYSKCKSQVVTKDHILEIVRTKAETACKYAKLRGSTDPLITTAGQLSNISIDPLLDQVAEAEGDDLVELRDDVEKAEEGTGNIGYALAKFIGLQHTRASTCSRET